MRKQVDPMQHVTHSKICHKVVSYTKYECNGNNKRLID
jgi:hypothetical protein